MRFSEAGGRFSHGHISRVTSFFPSFFRGPVAEGLPKHCVKKPWVKNGLDGVFFAASAFLVVFRTFLKQKTRRYTFSRPLPLKEPIVAVKGSISNSNSNNSWPQKAGVQLSPGKHPHLPVMSVACLNSTDDQGCQ